MTKNIIYFNNIEFRLVRFHGEDRHPVHIMHKDKPRFPWSETLRRAWWFIGFRNRLSHGFATFSFWKKDSSIREARGTLFMPLIPVDKHPKGDVGVRCTVYSVQNFTYFDLDKLEWRSFDIRNFIGFITYYRITGDQEPKKKGNKRKEPKEN